MLNQISIKFITLVSVFLPRGSAHISFDVKCWFYCFCVDGSWNLCMCWCFVFSVWTFWRCGNCTSPSLCGNGFARWLHRYLRPVSLAIWLHFDWSSAMNEEDNRNNRNNNSHWLDIVFTLFLGLNHKEWKTIQRNIISWYVLWNWTIARLVIIDGFFYYIPCWTGQEVARRLKVKAMPTFMFLKDGNTMDKLVGANPDEIKKRVDGFVQSSRLVHIA